MSRMKIRVAKALHQHPIETWTRRLARCQHTFAVRVAQTNGWVTHVVTWNLESNFSLAPKCRQERPLTRWDDKLRTFCRVEFPDTQCWMYVAASRRTRTGESDSEGKTRIWNAAGEEPPAVADLGGAGAQELVWVGDWSVPPELQGFTVLGSPLGHDAFVALHQNRLLQRIPTSMICKPRGCCSSLALPPAPTTCCVYCPRTSRLITQQTMIRPSHSASPAYLSSKPPSPFTVSGQLNSPKVRWARPALRQL